MNWRSVVHHVIACPLSFQLKGKVSDIIPLDETRVVSSEKGSIWRFAQPTDIDYMNPTTVSKYSAIKPVEDINCPVMLVSGTDDLNVPTDFTVKFIIDRLKENGKEHLCTNLSYPQAGHVIEPPYSPLCDFFSKSTKEGCGYPYVAWGGETVAHARTQEDCWLKILHFLRKHLQQDTQRVRNKNTLMLAMCLRTFTDNYRSPRLSFDPTLGSRNTQKKHVPRDYNLLHFPIQSCRWPSPTR